MVLVPVGMAPCSAVQGAMVIWCRFWLALLNVLKCLGSPPPPLNGDPAPQPKRQPSFQFASRAVVLIGFMSGLFFTLIWIHNWIGQIFMNNRAHRCLQVAILHEHESIVLIAWVHTVCCCHCLWHFITLVAWNLNYRCLEVLQMLHLALDHYIYI